MKEKRKLEISFFPPGDSQKSTRVFWNVYAWLGLSVKVGTFFFSPSRSNLGLVSSRFAGFVRNREIYNLGMVSGPILLKIEGKSWIFMKKWKSQPSFVTKSVRFGRTELLFLFPCSKSRDLQSEHGFKACSFKNIREKLDFHTFWDQPAEKKRNSGTKSVKCWSPEL